jgi:indolepyruvate ferredoxin oxidoreductase alpha subunit
VSHAAVLCPSFYRIEVVRNAGWFERLTGRLANAVIEPLQRRLAAREIRHAA